MLPNSLFPEIRPQQVEQQFAKLYLQWRIEWEKQQPPFVIENVRFTHDPEWQQQFVSIQCAHNLDHWAWKATAVVFALCGTGWVTIF
jgi:hypothetical protein